MNNLMRVKQRQKGQTKSNHTKTNKVHADVGVEFSSKLNAIKARIIWRNK